MVNSGGQNAAASDVYSSLERARSTPSARIVGWSNASGATAPASIHSACDASEPATGDGRSGSSARWATVTTRPRGTSTSWVRHYASGKVKHEGIGQSFWYRPLTAVLSEVPVDDRELPLQFHARTSDFADVTVQATVSYRIADPQRAASRLDFS